MAGAAAVRRAGQDSRARRRIAEDTAYHLSCYIGKVDEMHQHCLQPVLPNGLQGSPQRATHALLPVGRLHHSYLWVRRKVRAGKEIAYEVGLGAKDDDDRIAT